MQFTQLQQQRKFRARLFSPLKIMEFPALLALTLFVTGLLPHAAAFEWEDVPNSKDIAYSCVGQKVSFLWKFRQEAAEELVDIHWVFEGAFTTDIIASFAHDQFLPNPSYSGRVQHVPNGGLTLGDVTLSDAGIYTVEVNGYDTAGAFFSHSKSIFLQVADGLMVKNGVLHLYQDPVASWDSEQKEWVIKLVCGRFTYRGEPPLDVIWTTPTGETSASTAYDNGNFILALPSPVKGGNYTCSIPAHSLLDVCVTTAKDHGQDIAASVPVDEMKVRLSLVEAGEKTLKNDNRQLRQDNQRLLERLQSLETTHKENVSKMTADNQRLSERLRSLENTSREKAASLILKVEKNTDTILSLSNHLDELNQTINEKDEPGVAFSAKLSSYRRVDAGDRLILAGVTSNIGQGYDKTTGVFTAPVSGVYFLVGMASPGVNNYANLKIMVDGAAVAYSYAYQENNKYQTGTCHIVQRLTEGQQVWLESQRNTGYFWNRGTAFSGFLINADP